MDFKPPRGISSSFPEIPIILYTFYGFDAMIAEAKKHGIREVIDKAASGDYLLEAIEKHLSNVSRRLELPLSSQTTEASDKEEPPKTSM